MKSQEIISRINSITNISSKYMPVPGYDIEKQSKEMLTEIKSLEKEIEVWSAKLHYHIALAYRNYTAWYIRGENRKPFLELITSHLDDATKLDTQDYASKTELARMLIEEKQVRDLGKALEITNELIKVKALPSWMNSIVEKAKRWQGDISVPQDNDFSKLDPTPAVLREERTKLRKLLSESIKAKDSNAKVIALRLYNLALIVAYLYDDHDCKSGVRGYDKAAKKMKGIGNKFNFDYLGKIEDAGFLTNTDYKRIEKVLGEKPESIRVSAIKTLV